MAGRQPQSFRRHKVDEGIVQRRHRLVHGFDDGLILMRSGNGENAGMGGGNQVLLDAHAARDDDAPVLGHRLADGLQALLLG